MSTRPRRATRRAAIIDSDDDELANTTAKPQEDLEEDYENEAPAARRTTRSGRKSVAPAAAPTQPTKARRTTRKASASVSKIETPEPLPEPEASENVDPVESQDADATVQSVKADPQSPPAKRPQSRRQSAVPRSPLAPTQETVPPTPASTVSPQAAQAAASPLADITSASVNAAQVPDATQTIKPMKSMETFLDKQVDIVVKQRTTTVPFVEETTPKSRIVLTHLILNNFKSYAGRQEVGPFHASFSSVVGPNGSGKSNVIDSLLFVFGFRANKMRQGKVSALIHNSAQFPNLDHCEVAVHFQEVMDQVCIVGTQDQVGI